MSDLFPRESETSEADGFDAPSGEGTDVSSLKCLKPLQCGGVVEQRSPLEAGTPCPVCGGPTA